jgi:hypothetical protein
MPHMEFEKLDPIQEKYSTTFFESLGEKDARRFAAVLYEATRDMKYICQLLVINEKTVRKGLRELREDILPCPGRQRIKGGGRQVKHTDADLNIVFNEVIDPYIAGDPMNPEVKWTSLSRAEIKELLKPYGYHLCVNTIKKLLKFCGFKKRKIQKRKSLKVVADRDAQFKEINEARKEFTDSGNPVISVDTKKKESIGGNTRDGESYATGQVNGPDHTFGGLNTGKAVPHGIYDISNNHAYINIGKEAETAEFLVDSLILWWTNYGSKLYPDAKKILMLFDAGGANSYRHHLFKTAIIRLTQEIGIEVHIKHYPSYASKWNPIEHRVFCHVARVIKGVFIRSFEEFKNLVARAKTKTGLEVTVNEIEGDYKTGAKGLKEDWDGSIVFEEILPQWNYSCLPVC